MKQTMDWVGGIAQNKFSSDTGLPFEDAHVVRPNNIVTNGPFGDIKETIDGFIIVKGDSVDEAVEFAKGSPVLQGEGNSVEVRKIARQMVFTICYKASVVLQELSSLWSNKP